MCNVDYKCTYLMFNVYKIVSSEKYLIFFVYSYRFYVYERICNEYFRKFFFIVWVRDVVYWDK